jgi:D-arabinose 1-dehydrogenase-like Zn-dependent alcohol dehydrogenase
MLKLLIAAFGTEGLTYYRNCQALGFNVQVLDCFEEHHKQLCRWYGKDILHVQGRRADVREAVSKALFDVSIVHESPDFVRTALITQSLREAGVATIFVVTRASTHVSMYRKFGAHRVVVADSEYTAWQTILPYLPKFATA